MMIWQCVNIIFSKNATVLPDSECVSDAGVSVASTNQQVNGSTTDSTPSKNAASSSSVNVFARTAVTTLALGFAFGMSAF